MRWGVWNKAGSALALLSLVGTLGVVALLSRPQVRGIIKSTPKGCCKTETISMAKRGKSASGVTECEAGARAPAAAGERWQVMGELQGNFLQGAQS